jgi:uncharacterized protein (DUF433 family)
MGSRVTLDTIVAFCEQGESPEEIAAGFPSVRLADVYAIVSYYLKHKRQVRAYLREREKRAQVIRRKVEARSNDRDLKKRLLARRKAARCGVLLNGDERYRR